MTVSYAEQPLPAPTPEQADWVERNLTLDDVLEFSRLHWPTVGLLRHAFPGTMPDRPVQLGRLWWPAGAARFAVSHWLVNEKTADAIRDQVLSNGTSYDPATLKVTWVDARTGAEVDKVETDLYMLPARPLAVVPGVPEPLRQLWLLTLVDDRYFWWFRATDLAVTEGATEWSDLFDDLGTAIGTEIEHDSIDAAYLQPCKDFHTHYEYAPLLIDSLAYNVGMRVVRLLDGTVKAQLAENARQTLEQNILGPTAGSRMAGGFFLLTETAPDDLPAVLPEKVRLTFPKVIVGTSLITGASPENSTTCVEPDEVYSHEVTLEEAQPDGIPAGTTTFQGVKTFHDCAKALYEGDAADPTNKSDLDNLTKQFAKDWYSWQASPADVKLAGVPNVTPEPLSDSYEWIYTGLAGTLNRGQVASRIMRPPFNDLAQELSHYSPAADDACGNTSPCQPVTVLESMTVCSDGQVCYYSRTARLSVDDRGCLVKDADDWTLLCCCTCTEPPGTGTGGGSGVTVTCCAAPMPSVLYGSVFNKTGTCTCVPSLLTFTWNGTTAWVSDVIHGCAADPMTLSLFCRPGGVSCIGIAAISSQCVSMGSVNPASTCSCNPAFFSYRITALTDCCSGGFDMIVTE